MISSNLKIVIPNPRSLLLAACLTLAPGIALLTDAASASAAELTVPIVGLQYKPAQLSADVGDTVTWVNQNFIPHTVTAEDGSFDSGHIQGGKSFSFTFTSPGTFDYRCTIHHNMKGTVVVHGQAQTAPAPTPVTPPPVIVPQSTAPVHVDVHLTKLLGKRRNLTGVTVSAPQPGARVLLQLYSREHFSWLEVRSGKLSSTGRISFVLKTRLHLPLRAIVLPNGGGVSLSSTLHL